MITKDQILAAKQDRYLFSIIHDIFFETGISDWAAARALYYLGFSDQFYWFSAQSIEKLCKSALLSKWQNVEKYGHDIGKLCKKLSEVSEGGFDLSSYLEKVKNHKNTLQNSQSRQFPNLLRECHTVATQIRVIIALLSMAIMMIYIHLIRLFCN